MITYYSGTPGSGKSLHVAQVIEDYIQRGKSVIANFEFRDDLIKKPLRHEKGHFIYFPDAELLDNEKDPIDAFVGFAMNFHKADSRGCIYENQTLIIFDEAGILFNSRDWQSKYRMRWLWFFSQHRKYGYNIIVISQNERQIDRQIRSNFEYEVNHKKVGNFKKFGKVLSLLAGGQLFCCVTRWYGIKGMDGRVHSEFFRGRKKYYRMYNTSKIFGV